MPFCDHDFEPPLCSAARLGCGPEIVGLLLEYKADLTEVDCRGRTALSILSSKPLPAACTTVPPILDDASAATAFLLHLGEARRAGERPAAADGGARPEPMQSAAAPWAQALSWAASQQAQEHWPFPGAQQWGPAGYPQCSAAAFELGDDETMGARRARRALPEEEAFSLKVASKMLAKGADPDTCDRRSKPPADLAAAAGRQRLALLWRHYRATQAVAAISRASKVPARNLGPELTGLPEVLREVVFKFLLPGDVLARLASP